MIKVTVLVKTCSACPAQWEGETIDGRRVYVRYRSGCLRIGLGATLEEAVNRAMYTPFVIKQLGDAYDGSMTLGELVSATRNVIEWWDDCGA